MTKHSDSLGLFFMCEQRWHYLELQSQPINLSSFLVNFLSTPQTQIVADAQLGRQSSVYLMSFGGTGG